MVPATEVTLYYPPDMAQAAQRWQATCGPCSLASVVGVRVGLVKAFLPGYPGYTNPTLMRTALAKAGVLYTECKGALPRYGLVWLQWGGHDHLPARVQYKYTHWIATEVVMRRGTRLVFEPNAPYLVTWEEWQHVMPSWIKDEGQGDGTFTIRLGLEVRR